MARQTSRIALPTVSPGTRRELVVHRWGRVGARPKAYLQAALHAEEWPGLLTLHHLTRLLDQADRDGRIVGEVVVLPYANPVGLNQWINGQLIGRHQLADERGHFSNFNRDWPDLSEAAIGTVKDRLSDDREENVATVRAALRDAVAELPDRTEREAHRKALLGLSIDADYVFDLHSDEQALLHVYGNVHHGESLVALGRDLEAPLFLFETGAAGCFDDVNGAPWHRIRTALDLGDRLPLACFATTPELRGKRDVDDEVGGRDAKNLLRFLVRRGVVAGDPGPLPAPVGEPEPLKGIDWIKAPVAGLAVWKKRLGERVRAGELLVEMLDVAADDPDRARLPIHAETDGLLFSMLDDRMVRPGVTIGRIAGTETLGHRRALAEAMR